MNTDNSLSAKKKILILKNDAVGDLCQSLPAIQNIIDLKNTEIEIYLSERSKNFKFLILGNNIKFKILNYNLTFKDKFEIFLKCFTENIDRIYILSPKKFYFYLPFIFRKIRFYAICLKGPNNYLRPSLFLRKFLFRFVINDRSKIFKRDSSEQIQKKLTHENIINLNKPKIDIKPSEFLKKNIPTNFVYFHIKKKTIDKLGWDINDLNYLFENLLKYFDNVVLTRDIEKINENIDYSKYFNVIDFKFKTKQNINNKIFLFDNIEGSDLFNTLKYSSKIIAFHGMMTNLGSLVNKSITDLWFFDVKAWDDYRNYRNAFYEFKPKYNGYNFIIPNKDIKKTFKKLLFSIK